MYNIALFIVALIFIWRIIAGFRRGMVREIISLATMAVAVFCIVLILGAVDSYFNKEIGLLIQFVLVLGVVCLVYRLVNILFTSLQIMSKLPVIKGLDKLLGAVAGFAEAVIIVGALIHLIKNWGFSQIIR